MVRTWIFIYCFPCHGALMSGNGARTQPCVRSLVFILQFRLPSPCVSTLSPSLGNQLAYSSITIRRVHLGFSAKKLNSKHVHTFTHSLIHLEALRFIPINILSRGAFSPNERKRLAVSHFTLVCSIESIIFTCYVKKAIDTICALWQYIRINSNLNQAHTAPHHTTMPCQCVLWRVLRVVRAVRTPI